MDVKQAIEEVIPHAFETNKVISVQFENVNVKLGTASRDNRCAVFCENSETTKFQFLWLRSH